MRYRVDVTYKEDGKEHFDTKFIDADSREEAGRMVQQGYYESKINGVNETDYFSEQQYYHNRAVGGMMALVVMIIFFLWMMISSSVKQHNETYHPRGGIVDSGKILTKKTSYYYGYTPSYYNGWLEQSGGQWVYYDKSGKIVKENWVGDYYMNSAGLMLKNSWVNHKGSLYYLQGNGKIAKSQWINYDNSWFYVNSKGELVKNKWQDGCYLGIDGRMLTNTKTPDGKRVGSDGKVIK